MRITVCQVEPTPDALEAAFAQLADHARSEGTDVLLLPEMAFAEWLAADDAPDGERWAAAVEENLRWIHRLGELGVETALATRPIVTAEGSRRNEAYVWTASVPKPAPIRQKTFLPNEEGYWEASWYDRGPVEFPTATVGEVTIGVQICTEMWFLEWARHHARRNVDVLVTPRATPRSSTEKWVAGGITAAVCSGAYSVSSNLWHPEGVSAAECGGVGWIIDPEGNVIARTSADQPFATAEIDVDFARKSKSTYPRYVEE